MKDIIHSGQHLETVINDILDLSKIEAGKWQLDEEEFDLEECLRDSMRMVEADARRKKIDLKCGSFASLYVESITVIGDRHAFKRIFINLFSNAVKFTNEQGKVECFLISNNDDYVVVEIKDNGIGIDEEKISQALSPFGQAFDVRNLNETGTGLGLSIVIQLIELHGGTFKLSSEINKGTSAIISIPKNRIIENKVIS